MISTPQDHLSSDRFESWYEARHLFTELRRSLVSRRILCGVSAFALFLLVWICIVPQDDRWLQVLHSNKHKAVRDALQDLAGWISWLGDFGGSNAVLIVGLWIAGRVKASRNLRRLALASLLSAILTGAVVNTIRFTTGRPRPTSNTPDGWYGPSWKSEFHSFPSGHAGTAFGTSLPLLVGLPALGVPATLWAVSVAWARLYRYQHHPSDIAISVGIACLFGFPLGFAVRRLKIGPICQGDIDLDEVDFDEDEGGEYGEALHK